MARGKQYGPFEYERRLGQRNYTFKADVDEFVKATEKRMNALARQSIQDTVNIAQTAKAKGGNMPVDTGFLRASGQGSLNGMPTGPVRGDPEQKYEPNTQALITLLAELKVGATFFFGWTANYAKYREAYDGFLESAVQRWPETVRKVVEEIKKRSPNGGK